MLDYLNLKKAILLLKASCWQDYDNGVSRSSPAYFQLRKSLKIFAKFSSIKYIWLFAGS